MGKHWFKIVNTAEDPTEAEVLVYDEIGMFGITAKNFVEELKSSGAKKIHMRINSPGGDVFEGISIYNYLRTFKGAVRVTVDGLAASVASVVAMAGKTICMADGSMMMIHNPWGVVVGGSKDARDLADLLDKLRDQIVKAYSRTGQTVADIKAWMDEEKWMDASEAVDLGFADEVDAAMEVQNFACFNLAKFRNAPSVDTNDQSDMNLQEALAKISSLETNVTTLTGERDALKTGKAEAEATITTKNTEITALKASVTAKDSETATLKTALQSEKDGRAADKTASDKALEIRAEQITAKVDEELSKLGHRRLKTGTGTEAQMDRASFDKLSPKAQSDFCKTGGKIIDG